MKHNHNEIARLKPYGQLVFWGDAISSEEFLMLGYEYISYIRLEQKDDSADSYVFHVFSAAGKRIFRTDDPQELVGWMEENNRIPVALH